MRPVARRNRMAHVWGRLDLTDHGRVWALEASCTLQPCSAPAFPGSPPWPTDYATIGSAQSRTSMCAYGYTSPTGM